MANKAIGDATERTTLDGAEKLPISGTQHILISTIQTYIRGLLGVWTTYTTTWGGFSVNPSGGDAKYIRWGDLCHVSIGLPTNGTSTTGATTFTLPFKAAKAQRYSIIAVNNGAGVSGRCDTVAGSVTVTCYMSGAGGTFTTSGAKNVNVEIMYEVDATD